MGWLFIATGTVGMVYHGANLDREGLFESGLIWVLLVRALAVVFGVFLLRGKSWARWGLVAWLAYHVVLSAGHTLGGLMTHIVLLVVIGYFLFRPRASVYFRSGNK